MKKIALVLALFAMTLSGCALLGGLIPQDRKEEAVSKIVEFLCKDQDGAAAFLRGTEAEGAVEVVCR